MKPASNTLKSLLNSDTFLMADLYTIVLADGTVLRWTSADVAVNVPPYIWTPVLVKRGSTRITTGVEVDSLDVTFFEGGAYSLENFVTINGIYLNKFARQGGFDGATLLLERGFFTDWNAQPERVYMFSGLIGDVKPTRTQIDLTVNSSLYLLNAKLPRNIYTAGCRHQLYGDNCGLVKSAYSTTMTAGVCTTSLINTTSGAATGFYDQGTLAFLSGDLTGITRTIKHFTNGGQFELIQPLPSAPASGDTFKAYPGCDKNLATCSGKFNNVNRFGGHPYIPSPETGV